MGTACLTADNFTMDGKDAMTLADKKIRKNLQLWAAAGVMSADGSPLPKADPVARLVMPSGAEGQHFLSIAILTQFWTGTDQIITRWRLAIYRTC